MCDVIDTGQFFTPEKPHNRVMENDANKYLDYDDLMRKYVNICNQSLLENKERFPFKQIFEAAKTLQPRRVIEVTISEHAPSYVLYIKGASVAFDHHKLCGSCSCDGQWKIDREYLDDVLHNMSVYIENPARLNWEWLYL